MPRLKIGYIANPVSIHDCKWINVFSEKYEVFVITSSYDSSKSWLKDNIPVFTLLPRTYSVFNVFKTVRTSIHLCRFLSINKINVVHSMYSNPNSIWVYHTSFLNHIVTTRGSDLLVDYSLTYSSPHGLRKKIAYRRMKNLLRKTFAKATYITSTSKRQQTVLRSLDIDENKLHLIRTGVDVEFYQQDIQDSRISERKDRNVVIFSPRSMKPLYNIDIIIEAITILKKKIKNIKLKLIDDRPGSMYAQKIKGIIRQKQLSNVVTLVPRLSQKEMLIEYKSSDIVVMIPNSDGSPVTGIESMLARVPLILGNLNYDHDLFNDQTVWKTNDFKAQSLSNKMQEVLECEDELKSKKINKAFNSAVELTDIKKETNKVNDLYLKIMNRMNYDNNLPIVNKKTIIITSNEPWGKQWFSKHHYANELAKLGYKVFFINPVLDWCIRDIWSIHVSEEKIRDNLVVLSLRNNFPMRVFNRFFLRVNDFLNSLKLKKHVPNSSKEIIWWKFDVFRFINIDFFRNSRMIYHVVDPYIHFWQDRKHVQNANLVICTSEKYASFYNSYGRNPLIIPHGVAAGELCGKDGRLIQKLKEKYGNFAVITGTINSDWNFGLLTYLANEGIKMVIIGKEAELKDWKSLKQHQNIHYLGLAHADEVKNYITASKVCIVPYKFTNRLSSRTPLKFLNYLSQFKPIVTSFPTDMNEKTKSAIYFVKSKESFLYHTLKAINNRIVVNEDEIKKYLNSVRYPILIDKILVALDKPDL